MQMIPLRHSEVNSTTDKTLLILNSSDLHVCDLLSGRSIWKKDQFGHALLDLPNKFVCEEKVCMSFAAREYNDTLGLEAPFPVTLHQSFL